MTDSCSSCKFSDLLVLDFDDQDEKQPHLICRRYPPQMTERITLWPLIHEGEWCGEFQLNKEKV